MGDHVRIILLEINEVKLAVLVDSVQSIISIDNSIRERLEFLPVQNNQYLKGIVKIDDASLLYPDIVQIYWEIFINQKKPFSQLSGGSNE